VPDLRQERFSWQRIDMSWQHRATPMQPLFATRSQATGAGDDAMDLDREVRQRWTSQVRVMTTRLD